MFEYLCAEEVGVHSARSDGRSQPGAYHPTPAHSSSNLTKIEQGSELPWSYPSLGRVTPFVQQRAQQELWHTLGGQRLFVCVQRRRGTEVSDPMDTGNPVPANPPTPRLIVQPKWIKIEQG